VCAWVLGSHFPFSIFSLLFSSFVSAGAKIPIVPFEFSPPVDVVNRNRLHTEEVPKLVKGAPGAPGSVFYLGLGFLFSANSMVSV